MVLHSFVENYQYLKMKMRKRIIKIVFNRKPKSDNVVVFSEETRISYVFLWALILALLTSLIFFFVGTKIIFG